MPNPATTEAVTPTRAPLALEWASDHLLRIDDVEFYLTVDLDELHAHQSRRNHFLLGKTRPMLDAVLALRDTENIGRILDVGIFKGGSAALYMSVFAPQKLVAVEYLPRPVEALAQFIADNDLASRLIPYYGTDQSDARAMSRILATEFPDRNIDLIVDETFNGAGRTQAFLASTAGASLFDAVFRIDNGAADVVAYEGQALPGGVGTYISFANQDILFGSTAVRTPSRVVAFTSLGS